MSLRNNLKYNSPAISVTITKRTEISRSRLPRGLITDAEARVQEPAGEIEKLLKRKDKTPLQRWKDFVEKEFYNIADRIEQENDDIQESHMNL
ncbi:hypothetical protein AB4K20DRAFT_1944892 [Rhizopus microsporus]